MGEQTQRPNNARNLYGRLRVSRTASSDMVFFFSCGTFSRFPILFFVFWGIEYCYFRPSYSPFPRLEYLSRQFGSCGKRTYVEKVEIGAELLLPFPWSRHFSKAVFGKFVQFGLVSLLLPPKKSFYYLCWIWDSNLYVRELYVQRGPWGAYE